MPNLGSNTNNKKNKIIKKDGDFGKAKKNINDPNLKIITWNPTRIIRSRILKYYILYYMYINIIF